VEQLKDHFKGTPAEVLGTVGGSNRHLGLRMAPMIDVIFLLLTFFVLTAKFRTPEQFLPIHLPTAEAGVERIAPIEPLIINISAVEGGCEVKIAQLASVRVEQSRYAEGLAELASELAGVLNQQKRTSGDPIEIRCADEVSWDNLVKVYNVLQAAGINDITFQMTGQVNEPADK